MKLKLVLKEGRKKRNGRGDCEASIQIAWVDTDVTDQDKAT